MVTQSKKILIVTTVISLVVGGASAAGLVLAYQLRTLETFPLVMNGISCIMLLLLGCWGLYILTSKDKQK